MMFIGLTSAYVVSQGLDPMWKQVPMRPLIWINTFVLLVSSYTMERARRGFSAKWLIGTLLLGLTFVAGQIGVFAQLADVGLRLSTGRQASFYYVLTSLHGLHILGGVAGLAWTALRMKKSSMEVISLYWHFMGGLWIYLLLVILNFLFIQKIAAFKSITYATGCLLIIAICIYYFYELFQLTHSVNLVRQPAFWICSGLLFYYSCSFPIFGLTNFVRSAPLIIFKNIGVIIFLLNVFLYSSFTIAFLCRLRTRKSMS